MFKVILALFLLTSTACAGTHVQTTSTSAVDNSIVRMNGVSGQIIQNSSPVIDDSGNIGIGTIDPFGSLIVASGNVGIGTLRPGMQFDNFGNLRISGGGFLVSNQATAPTIANNDCGTTVQGTVAANSTDLLGTITVGTIAPTSCAMTFNKTHTAAPICFCQDDTNILAIKCTASTTKLTASASVSLQGDVLAYWCPTNIP